MVLILIRNLKTLNFLLLEFCVDVVLELNFLVENLDLHTDLHLGMIAKNDAMNVVKEVTMLEIVKDLDDELGKPCIFKVQFSNYNKDFC